MQDPVEVVGGGLAGCEAAWQLAEAGVRVVLHEMRPQRTTPVHSGDGLAQLVCSNSLRGDAPTNAVGLLKREMALLGSIIIRCARASAVPAGGALAVDRDRFSQAVTDAVAGHRRIEVRRGEVTRLPAGPAVLATGPLTSPALHGELESLLGEGSLSFFDAIAPIVAADSLDRSRLFAASRYDKGDGADYLNAAMDQATYEHFVRELVAADAVPYKSFEAADIRYFEGCLPLEVMARRGPETLRFGPLKPVGLTDPATGRRPWAAVQLRQDDLAAEHWNLVGFQTKLTRGEQQRVFRLIPGLERARFVRYGMIHRNTYVNSPAHLDPLLRVQLRPTLRLAGQMTGVEGYVESAATGLIAARSLAAELAGADLPPPPPTTACGGLVRHLTERPADRFEPSNITWGLMVCPAEARGQRGRRARRERHAAIALEHIREWSRRVPAAGAGATA